MHIEIYFASSLKTFFKTKNNLTLVTGSGIDSANYLNLKKLFFSSFEESSHLDLGSS
jgi:hypothetical protein